ncbi:hypothetical protein SANTM175S_05809 [Streptomyces antimycoticus]
MSLRDLIRDEMAAPRPRSERLAAMRSARLYFRRPDEPGFLVSDTERGPVLRDFTFLATPALFGRAVQMGVDDHDGCGRTATRERARVGGPLGPPRYQEHFSPRTGREGTMAEHDGGASSSGGPKAG